MLGKIPIETTIRVNADLGMPIAFTECKTSELYCDIARRMETL